MPSAVDYKNKVTSWLIANGMISTLIQLTVMEEQRLRVFGNLVMRKLFRPEREKGVKLWRKLCNEVLHGLHTSLDIVRMMKEKEVEWRRREMNVRKLKKNRVLGACRHVLLQDSIQSEELQASLAKSQVSEIKMVLPMCFEHYNSEVCVLLYRSLSGNRIKYIPGGILQQASGLTLLELKGNPLMGVHPHAFSFLPNLRKLYVF
jgi:hypothetical protein